MKLIDKEKRAARTKRQRFIRFMSILIVALTLAFSAVLFKDYLDGDFNDIESLQAYIERYGIWGPLFLTFFQFLQVVIPILPGFLGCIVGSILFGPFVGFLCNYIGIGVGSIAAFFLARRFGKPLVDDLFPNGRYHRWAAWASKSKSYTAFLFAAMILPLFPDDFLCYLTGLSTMTKQKFIWIVILGKPWCILAYSIGFSFIK